MSLPKSLIWLLFCLLLWCVAFYESLLSAYNVWMLSATYNHCLFVIPISLYLIWQKIPDLLLKKAEPNYIALCLIIALMLVWALGFAGNINLFQHFAVFSILPLIFLASFGWRASRVILFPLLFILFAIPVGEELIPLFQQITADISVQMLLWSGVPVFREGLFIQVPGGKFLVAEACSGIRFFVSTVMLGSLCSYMFFRSFKKRLLFMLFSIILPIIANAIRAYGIMIVGYLTGMEHAVGADHLIYGWFFFALVTGLLILCANFFKEAELEVRKTINAENLNASWFSLPDKSFMVSFVVVFISFFLWKFAVIKSPDTKFNADLSILEEKFPSSSKQIKPGSVLNWSPIFDDADIQFQARTFNGLKEVQLHFLAFTGATEAELISWNNRVFEPNDWTLESSSSFNIKIEAHELPVTVLKIVSNAGRKRTIFYWYQAPGVLSNNKFEVKIWQALNVLSGIGKGGAFVAVSSPSDNAESLLSAWVQENYKSIASAYLTTEKETKSAELMMEKQ